MSTLLELRTLVRLAPHVTATLIPDANLNTLLGKAQIALGVDGRAMPKNEKIDVVANQAEYVLSGASSVLTDNDFLAIDLRGGGVLFSNGTSWFGPQEGFVPKSKEWLDLNRPGWRTEGSAATPLYFYIDTGVETSNLVVGLFNKPSTTRTDGLWINYLGRGILPSADAHYPFTGSATQLRHLEMYDPLFVYYALEWINRLILSNPEEANLYKELYTVGAVAMANRLPLEEHLLKEGFAAPSYFASMGGRRRY